MAVNRFTSACSHYRNLREEGIHFARSFIQHVCAIAFNARRMAGNDDAQVVLGNDFYGIEVGKDGNVRVTFHFFYQAGLDFSSGIILMMQDAELRVPAFTVQVKLSVFFFIEVYTPLD